MCKKQNDAEYYHLKKIKFLNAERKVLPLISGN